MREYLSFLREIFYYEKDMDEVDFDLAVDTLEVTNDLLRKSPIIRDKGSSLE